MHCITFPIISIHDDDNSQTFCYRDNVICYASIRIALLVPSTICTTYIATTCLLTLKVCSEIKEFGREASVVDNMEKLIRMDHHPGSCSDN